MSRLILLQPIVSDPDKSVVEEIFGVTFIEEYDPHEKLIEDERFTDYQNDKYEQTLASCFYE